MALYLVGSDKPYTTHQAAIDAIILDFLGTMTEDVEVRSNSGETFTDNGFTDLIVTAALNTGGFRLTITAENPNDMSIVDMADNASSRFFFNDAQSGALKKFTFRGIKVIGQFGLPHTIIGSGDQKNGGSIIERCDFEVKSRVIFKFNAASFVSPVIHRNNYFHGRNGSFYADFPMDSPGYSIVTGCTFRRCDKVYELDITGVGPVKSFDNIFQDIGINLIESNGSLAQFNAGYEANGNLYFGTPADFLSLYSVPAVYTLAAYRAFASTPDAVYVSADPLLISFADPHMDTGSPAKWAGVDYAYLTEDIDGDPRHSPPSIGADEFSAQGGGGVIVSGRRRGRR